MERWGGEVRWGVGGEVVSRGKLSCSDTGEYRCDQWYWKGRDRYENSFNVKTEQLSPCAQRVVRVFLNDSVFLMCYWGLFFPPALFYYIIASSTGLLLKTMGLKICPPLPLSPSPCMS